MDHKNIQRYYFRLISTLFLLISGCLNSDVSSERDLHLLSPLSELTTTSTPILPKYWIAPEPEGCEDLSNTYGKILFLQQSTKYDLYMMNGFGCQYRLVLEKVFGSPSWSTDGKMIAIGCDDEKYICILDAKQTLEPCLQLKKDGEQCDVVFVKKIKIPSDEPIYIYNTTWSYDNNQIALNGEYINSKKEFVTLISLTDVEDWKIIIESSAGALHSAISPIKNELAIDGLYIISLDGGVLKKPVVGFSPAWSHDGLKIAYLTSSFSEDGNVTGVVEYDFTKDVLRLLYQPITFNESYSPRVNIRIRDESGGNKPNMSWSPDDRYIAFSAVYRHSNDSQIFRLDTITGEVVALTTKLESEFGQNYYYAPAWGP